MAETNYFQAATQPEKLRGQYYTPDTLVAMILDALPLTPEHVIIDPACGDGSFLCGAVAAVARRFPAADREALAQQWAQRIVGFDIDAGAVIAARANLRRAFVEAMGVCISPKSVRMQARDLLAGPYLRALVADGLGGRPPLLVVGNPPYVEAKRLDRDTKARLRARYPEAISGAPDLYLYFLHVCLDWLGREDHLALVLPNKLLVNSNAQRLRERLLDEGRLRGLWFATQTGVFGGAAVYPIVLFASGARPDAGEPIACASISRDERGDLVRVATTSISATAYAHTRARAFFPPPRAPLLGPVLDRLLNPAGATRLDALLDIRWTISFHRAGLRERYVTPERPEDPSARRFLGGGPFTGNGEVTRYGIEWAGWWIRYDTAALAAEQNALPHPGMFEAPKLVICQNGRTLRAAYDDQGFVLKDTFLCGAIRKVDHALCRHPRAVVGLLCSRAVHFFYAHVFYGGHVNGGYLHFLRSFLIDIPCGEWTDNDAESVAALVRKRESAPATEWEAIEGAIEARVAAALGLTETEQAAIVEWAVTDENWQRRERVRR